MKSPALVWPSGCRHTTARRSDPVVRRVLYDIGGSELPHDRRVEPSLCSFDTGQFWLVNNVLRSVLPASERGTVQAVVQEVLVRAQTIVLPHHAIASPHRVCMGAAVESFDRSGSGWGDAKAATIHTQCSDTLVTSLVASHRWECVPSLKWLCCCVRSAPGGRPVHYAATCSTAVLQPQVLHWSE